MDIVKVKPFEYNEQLIYSSKVSEILPFLKLIATDNNLDLSKDMAKAMKILINQINNN